MPRQLQGEHVNMKVDSLFLPPERVPGCTYQFMKGDTIDSLAEADESLLPTPRYSHSLLIMIIVKPPAHRFHARRTDQRAASFGWRTCHPGPTLNLHSIEFGVSGWRGTARSEVSAWERAEVIEVELVMKWCPPPRAMQRMSLASPGTSKAPPKDTIYPDGPINPCISWIWRGYRHHDGPTTRQGTDPSAPEPSTTGLA
ncbi:hypothetical protein BKA70DRAFT_1432904 [Coprinopsis sp. MPI-PUGE-AT-0042]|nr:hypothetical protein BKA70DRAFT_1432904 [Coprinopsis sp. MPI-PUGE-AT-0042]